MNVQMIAVEPWDLNVVVVTQGGAATRADQDKAQEQLQPQVWPMKQKKASFNVQQQKEIFLEVWLEFVDSLEPSMLEGVKEMP